MPRVYKRTCDYCGEEYTGFGEKYCSVGCLGKSKRPEPVESLEADHPQLLALEQKNLALQDTIRGLRTKLKAAQRERTTIQFAAEVVREATQPLDPVPVILRKAKRSATAVDAIALLSDEHADEVLNPAAAWGMDGYDFNIFRCRLQRWAEELAEYLTCHLPAHDFERLWVWKLGDSLNGDIHGMRDKNAFANTLKAALATGDAEAHALQFLLRETGLPIHVVSVSGNHPRRTAKKAHDGPHDNFDYLVTSQLATRLENQPEIEVIAPEAWTAFVSVRGHLCALNHGDDIRGTWGIPWYGVDRRANRIQALVGKKGAQVRYFFYGHFHQVANVPVGGADARFNGPFPMTSPYSLDGLALASEPAQSVFVVSDKGIILQADIWVRDLEREDLFRAGRWNPVVGAETILDELTPPDSPIGELDIIRASD